MKRTVFAALVAAILGGAAFSLSGCYATSAGVSVGVDAPPEPVGVYYDSRPGSVWIDGHWVWTAAGWQWYPGYWEAARPGYVYVQGYWDYWDSRYFWRPGTWCRYNDGYVWLDNRWTIYQRGYHHYNYRTHQWVQVRDHRTGVYRGGGREPVRDHRTGRSGTVYQNRIYRAPSRTYTPGHRSRGSVRDHRRHR